MTEEEPSTAEEDAPDAPEPLSTPLERARAALAGDSVDTDALSSSLDELEAELSSAHAELDAAEAQTSSLEASLTTSKDQYLRLTADFENFRRRTATEKEELTDRVRGDVLQQLLPLIDNFELARTQVSSLRPRRGR